MIHFCFSPCNGNGVGCYAQPRPGVCLLFHWSLITQEISTVFRTVLSGLNDALGIAGELNEWCVKHSWWTKLNLQSQTLPKSSGIRFLFGITLKEKSNRQAHFWMYFKFVWLGQNSILFSGTFSAVAKEYFLKHCRKIFWNDWGGHNTCENVHLYVYIEMPSFIPVTLCQI